METLRAAYRGAAQALWPASGEPPAANGAARGAANGQEAARAAPGDAKPPSETKLLEQARALTLEQASERVNLAKAAYDECESKRMTAVMNGRDVQEFSCEREFVAFTKAFDLQLIVEAKRS